MPNVLNVTLDTNAGALNVDDRNNANHVPRSQYPQTVAWQLTGNAATGSFTAFSWVGVNPAAGVFSAPTFSANGNELTITDNNTSAQSAGTYTYRITATINGVSYSTLSSIRTTATTSDPVIRNN